MSRTTAWRSSLRWSSCRASLARRLLLTHRTSSVFPSRSRRTGTQTAVSLKGRYGRGSAEHCASHSTTERESDAAAPPSCCRRRGGRLLNRVDRYPGSGRRGVLCVLSDVVGDELVTDSVVRMVLRHVLVSASIELRIIGASERSPTWTIHLPHRSSLRMRRRPSSASSTPVKAHRRVNLTAAPASVDGVPCTQTPSTLYRSDPEGPLWANRRQWGKQGANGGLLASVRASCYE
jgi:hypothetical protein